VPATRDPRHPPAGGGGAAMRLRIDPIACESHALCAELVPELITLDDWGHPVLADVDVSASMQRLVRQAVSACPTLALRLEDTDA
jgi:ferredoxin